MRISDWSSDVCSSDLGLGGAWRREPAAVLAAVFLVAALALPLAQTSEGDAQGWFSQPELPLIWLACFLTAARQGFLAQRGPLPGLLLTLAAVVGAFAPLRATAVHREIGRASRRERGCPYV